MVRPTAAAADTCLFVVGGGPAGLAAAIAARKRGLQVIVADRAKPPIDKACGEGLMPDGVAALREIGVELTAADGVPFRGIRFLDRELQAEARFPNSGCGLGMRRTRLHEILIRAAEQAGAELWWQTPVEAVEEGRVTAGGRTVRCRWIAGADGALSRVREWCGLQPVWSTARRMGLRQRFRIEPWTDFVEVYWAGNCQAYVTPTGPDEICVALLGTERSWRGGTAIRLSKARRPSGRSRTVGGRAWRDLDVFAIGRGNQGKRCAAWRCVGNGGCDNGRRHALGVPAGGRSGGSARRQRSEHATLPLIAGCKRCRS